MRRRGAPAAFCVLEKSVFFSAKHGTVSKVVKYGSRTNAFVIAPREVEVIKTIPEDEAWKIVEEVLNV